LLAQHVSEHHHQELESIIQVVAACRVWCFGAEVAACRIWCFGVDVYVSALRAVAAAARKPDTQPSAPHHTDNLKTKAPNMTGSNHLCNTF